VLSRLLDRYRAAFAGLPREVWMLALVLLVNRSGSMVLPFLTIYFTSQLEMTEVLAGRMISIYGLGAVCGAYLGGRLVGRVGAIRLQTICLTLTAPGYLVIPLFDDWRYVALALFATSLFAEAVRPANATAIAKLTVRSDRMRAFALQRLAANLGFSIGPSVGGILATINYSLLFVVDGLTTLAAAGLVVWFFRMRRIPGETEPSQALAPRTRVLNDRVYVCYLLLTLLTALVFFQFCATYPLYLQQHYDFSKPQIGMVFAVNTLVIVLFEMVLVDALRHLPVVRTIGWGCFLTCVGFGILPLGTTGAFCVFAMLVMTAGEMLSAPLSATFVANRSPEGAEGDYMGWFALVMSSAAVLAPALGSTLYAINPHSVWYAGLGIGALVLIGFGALSRTLGESTSSPLAATQPGRSETS
jgi:predicted MFS family arabinose efflux permease